MLLDPSMPFGSSADTALENLSLPINQSRRGNFQDTGERVPIKKERKIECRQFEKSSSTKIDFNQFLHINKCLLLQKSKRHLLIFLNKYKLFTCYLLLHQ